MTYSDGRLASHDLVPCHSPFLFLYDWQISAWSCFVKRRCVDAMEFFSLVSRQNMMRAASFFDWQGVFGETALFPGRRAFRMLEGEVAYALVPVVGAARVVDGGNRSGM